MKRVESARKKRLQGSDHIYWTGYVRFFNQDKFIYQLTSEIVRLSRQDALADAKQL